MWNVWIGTTTVHSVAKSFLRIPLLAVMSLNTPGIQALAEDGCRQLTEM